MKVKQINDPITSNYGMNLLLARGITDPKKFLNPDDTCLQSWEDLENIDEAVAVVATLKPNAKIALIVDCDCDGFTSAAILVQYIELTRPGYDIHTFIHESKAHGLEEHWEAIRDEGFDLVIVPDAGSNDGEYAAELECPVLVLDHHIVEPDKQSDNMIVVNNQSSPNYHNKNLSGAGIALQFCRAYDATYLYNFSDKFWDLAALGVCGDMMSGLEIENQYIWHRGFSNIKNPFFWALADRQSYSITGQMSPTDQTIISALNPTSVAFYIVPLINAMVRMGTMEEKSRMFMAFVKGKELVSSNKRGAKGTLVPVAEESARECVNARAHQNKIKDDTVFGLEQKIFKYDLLENKILFVILDEDDVFPNELNGLIAMQLSQKYKRPTIIARRNSEDFVRGSIRGLSNCELTSFKAYLDSTGLCEYVQGHDNAAGISISYTNVDSLLSKANDDFAQYNFGENVYEVNFERQALSKDLPDLIYDLSNYKAVWSQQNNEPLIYVKDFHFKKSDIQIMGKNQDTIKIVKNGVAYMKFFAKDFIEDLQQLPNDLKIEIVGKANVNTWGGRTTPQIFIEDFDIKEDNKLDF